MTVEDPTDQRLLKLNDGKKGGEKKAYLSAGENTGYLPKSGVEAQARFSAYRKYHKFWNLSNDCQWQANFIAFGDILLDIKPGEETGEIRGKNGGAFRVDDFFEGLSYFVSGTKEADWNTIKAKIGMDAAFIEVEFDPKYMALNYPGALYKHISFAGFGNVYTNYVNGNLSNGNSLDLYYELTKPDKPKKWAYQTITREK